jgi:hypothetical protein
MAAKRKSTGPKSKAKRSAGRAKTGSRSENLRSSRSTSSGQAAAGKGAEHREVRGWPEPGPVGQRTERSERPYRDASRGSTYPESEDMRRGGQSRDVATDVERGGGGGDVERVQTKTARELDPRHEERPRREERYGSRGP